MIVDLTKPVNAGEKSTITVVMGIEEATMLAIQWDLYYESLMVSGPMRELFRGIVRALARDPENRFADPNHPINQTRMR